MKENKTLDMLGVVGMCVGVALAAGCKTRYSNCSFEGGEAGGGDLAALENPMPAAVSPVQPADVVYPAPPAPKAPQYWEEHRDPYAGLAKPAAAKPAAAPAGYAKHTVQKGETLGAIAKRHGVSLKSVMAANGGINYNKLRIGQTVYIPAATASNRPAAGKAAPAASREGTYTVRKGDILGRIARQHGVKLSALKAANGLSGDRIVAGQKLVIPGRAPAKSAEVARLPESPKRPDPSAPAPAKAPADAPVPAKAPADAPALAPVAAPELPDLEMPAIGVPTIVVPGAPAGQVVNYTVRPGEDLYTIAINHSVGINDIRAANPGIEDNPVAGMIIRLPVK